MKLSNFSDFARVVIIDDKEDEGNGIKEALETIGVPSLFYHVTSNRSLENKLCKNIRLVFLDLIFSNMVKSYHRGCSDSISRTDRKTD